MLNLNRIILKRINDESNSTREDLSLRLQTTSASSELMKRHVERLEHLQKFVPNLEIEKDTSDERPYGFVDGEIRYGSLFSQMRTAISFRLSEKKSQDDAEFSTQLGRLPNIPISNTVVELLNRSVDGKFITHNNDQSETVDLVYTSRQPANWVDAAKIRRELENHAKTKTLITPLLGQLPVNSQPSEVVKCIIYQNFARKIVYECFEIATKTDNEVLSQNVSENSLKKEPNILHQFRKVGS